MKNNDKTHLTLDFLKQKSAYEDSKLITIKAEKAARIVGISSRSIRTHLHRLAESGHINLTVYAGLPFVVEVL